MNFFGHAVFATWRSESGRASPGYVLGAMLPDFANMIGARAPRALDAAVEDGIRFHHHTDAVFHDTETFRALQAEARAALRELGLGRAPALAVGHIGVEILLDASLATDPAGVRGYLGALDEGARDVGTVEWDDGESSERYRGLCELLARRGVTPGAADPAAVAYRVSRALSPRPRLRLEEGGERLVQEWAEGARAGIASAAPRLVAEVSAGLATRGQILVVPPVFG